MNITDILRRHSTLIVLILLSLTFLPWLGMSLFNTKGEPREAIVAVSMLQSGNWILPESFGGDIPYKPPFLAWCIAVISLITGGVTEFSSRLPSAIAVIAMGVATYKFFKRHSGSRRRGGMTALVLVSCIEVWRAGMACRVDMVLTACIVGALYSLYNYRNSGYKGLPWIAILLMTMGMLTKGPVAIFLPCVCLGVFGLLRGDKFWPLSGRMAASGLLALTVPAMWYVAAWQIGGQEFFDLAWEENFGRLTGTMSYESHVNPWWYNIVTLIAGWLPYTLLAVMALPVARWKVLAHTSWIGDSWRRMRRMHPATLFATVCAGVIFVFYCIPSSKRSVYLLPMYPFMAYMLTLLVLWMANSTLAARRLLKCYCGIIAGLAVAVPIVLIYAHWRGVMLMVHEPLASLLANIPQGFVGWGLTLICMGCGAQTLYLLLCRKPLFCFNAAVATTFVMLWLTAGGVLPVILGAKSDRPVAEAVQQTVPADAEIYSWVSTDMLRYYTVNFYLHDRVRVLNPESLPQSGHLLVGESDRELIEPLLSEHGYEVKEVLNSNHRSCDTRQNILLLTFKK
ncbi:MAG: glycosyltransferase family 39 protein [Paramuribaculum sp.]|nr:glycosyltransferase family 39 protein [Paramuribaculum sp.]